MNERGAVKSLAAGAARKDGTRKGQDHSDRIDGEPPGARLWEEHIEVPVQPHDQRIALTYFLINCALWDTPLSLLNNIFN